MPSRTEIKFGTDGWRAIIGDEFILENVRKVALGVAKYLKENSKNNTSIVIGYDTRFLSENFATSVAEIIASYGINIKSDHGSEFALHQDQSWQNLEGLVVPSQLTLQPFQ